MKILVTGSSGLVGTALASALASAGHTVCRLVRPQSAASEGPKEGFAVVWNPATGELGGAGVGADAVVNLAGASIADGRWTAERKALLRSSRIDTTRALVSALAKMNARPSVLVSASAIGIYGNRGDETLTEESMPGTDFLAGLTREWEAEALKAEALGIRVVLARFGIILARDGGALPKMILPFKIGAGGKLGSGRQWMSWVTLEDVVGILRLAIEGASSRGAVNTATVRGAGNVAPVRGAINIVSPQPVQNAEFTKALANAMRRPALFPALEQNPALLLDVNRDGDAKCVSIQWIGGQKILRSLSILQNQIFVSSKLANHWLASRVGHESLTLGGFVGVERGPVENQIKMKAAFVFGFDTTVDVSADIHVDSLLVLAFRLDGNADARPKPR